MTFCRSAYPSGYGLGTPGRRIIKQLVPQFTEPCTESNEQIHVEGPPRLTENIGRCAWSVGSVFDQGSAAMSLLVNPFGRSVGIDLEVHR
jgi:hypothetical protein